MFNFGLSQGRAFSMYRANVSYTWGTTLAQDGTRHLKDLGKSPKLSVQLEGNGLHLNGVDQSLVVELPHELGDEEVLNGDFNTDSDWSKGTGWTIANGVATREDTEGYSSIAQYEVPLMQDVYYLVSWEQLDIVSNGYRVRYAGDYYGEYHGSNGIQRELILSDTSDGKFELFGNSDSSGSVDNVSIKQITQEELHLYTFNHDTSNIEYQNITTPIPYYDFGKVDGTGDYLERVIGNTIATKQAFTSRQLEALYKEPERFLYRQNETIKSFVLSQAEIDNVVKWMTNTDNDEFSRELVGYSEGDNVVANSTFETDLSKWSLGETGNGSTVWDNGRAHLVSGGDFARITQDCMTTGNLFLITFTLEMVSGSCEIVGVQPLIYSESGVYTFVGIPSGDFGFKRVGVCEFYIDNVLVKQLSGINPITNPTDACRDDAKQLTNGYQHTAGVVTDSFNMPINYIDALVLKGTERPALAIPLTDTELWNNGTGFVIEFVISRELINGYYYLLNSFNSNYGFYLAVNKTGAPEELILRIGQGDGTNMAISSMFDSEYHHIAFMVTSTQVTMLVDNVEIDTKEHSFVSSGLSFADSTQLAPKAKMPLFKMWYGDNYVKYDREKSAELGRETIANIEGWEDKGSVDIELFNYEPANGDRLIENGGE